MKVEIDLFGVMEVKAESPTEEFALVKWCELWREGGLASICIKAPLASAAKRLLIQPRKDDLDKS